MHYIFHKIKELIQLKVQKIINVQFVMVLNPNFSTFILIIQKILLIIHNLQLCDINLLIQLKMLLILELKVANKFI